MGRRIRWIYYYFKKALFWLAVGWLVLQTVQYLNKHYNANVESVAQTVIMPQIKEVDAKGVEKFLREPRQVTLIFIYSSRSILSRWYFDDFNQMAAKYARYGVRILFISVDSNVQNMAEFLAAQGTIYFTPLHMGGPDASLFPDIIGRLGGDPFGGALPYMGIMDKSLFLRDFSQAIVRTGKIEEVLDQTLRGR